MALKDWYSQEIYFEFANKYLLQHKKAPSAVVMREAFGNNGSLSTHQALLETWKKEQDVEIIELPQKVEETIGKKTRELFIEGWKALENASGERNLKIRQEAEEAVEVARIEVRQLTEEKDALEIDIVNVIEKMEHANSQNKALEEKIKESEKLRFAADAARQELNTRLNELKAYTEQEKNEREKQFLTRIAELQHQITANENKYQQDLNGREDVWQKERKDYESELATLDTIRNGLSEQLAQAKSSISSYENKYNSIQQDIQRLSQEIVNLKDEKLELRECCEEYRDISIKQSGQIEQLEKQLIEYRERNSSLENLFHLKNLHIGELKEKLNREIERKLEEAIGSPVS